MGAGKSEANMNKEPLKVSCLATDCESDLHCFRLTRRDHPANPGQTCRECGVGLVPWDRVHRRNLEDVEHTFRMLKYELIRHHFWHKGIDDELVGSAPRKGFTKLRETIHHRIEKYVAPLDNQWDGRQTPTEGNVVYYAQHATASCCRRCIEEWHGISRDAPLTPDVIDYLTELGAMYVRERMPDLANEPVQNSGHRRNPRVKQLMLSLE